MADAKTIKGVLLDTEKGTAKITTLCDELDAYYAALHCDIIDIVTRKIGDKLFSIVCDDEALLKDRPVVSAVSGRRKPMLFGSLFVVSVETEDKFSVLGFNGELVGLTDEDCRYVFEHLESVLLTDPEKGTGQAVLVLSDVGYPTYREG